jgi:peroxiredoxin
LPALQAAYTAYRDEIGFIAVNVKEDPATVAALVDELGLNFPIALDPDGQVSHVAYEVRGIPTTVFVDPYGVVAARHVGPLDEATIDGYLAPLFEAKTQIAEPSSLPTFQPSNLPTLPSAPAFSLTAATGDTISLQDYRDRRHVVLVFYRGHT